LGNGELASLAYGSLKELLQIEELLLREVMVLRTLDPGFVSIPGDLWPVFQCFRPLGLVFEWFFCGTLDPAFQLFVLDPLMLGSVFIKGRFLRLLVSCSCARRSHGILPRVHFRHAVYLTYPE
jgi:hypothetical protein